MTGLSLRSIDIPSIYKFAVGFDNMFEDLAKISTSNHANYPPYNVLKHSEDNFSIELAVAGFAEEDIEITVEKQQLTIKGEKATQVTETEPQYSYLHRGLGGRSFYRSWTLADHIEVKDAILKNGILTVGLERIVPEEQKPKKIQISNSK